jgi:hypothetical protein
MTPHVLSDSGLASPEHMINTGFPYVVIEPLTTIFGNVPPVAIVFDP